jgi:hypothetical protein
VGFGDGLHHTSLRIPLAASARHVIVAHRLLGSKILDGGGVGLPVAEYVFHFDDGHTERCAVRERFEIADLADFGQLPFACLPDQPPALAARWRGDWSEAGFRQTESSLGWPRVYYLWSWTNPRPEVPLRELEVVPGERRFVIGAVTLGQADEEPFVRSGAVPVRIELKDPQQAERELAATDLQLSVDRGVAGYVYLLPRQTADAFLDDAFAGWGEANNPGSSPAYTTVAAIGSATLGVRLDDENG